jgi:hypothetical protein
MMRIIRRHESGNPSRGRSVLDYLRSRQEEFSIVSPESIPARSRRAPTAAAAITQDIQKRTAIGLLYNLPARFCEQRPDCVQYLDADLFCLGKLTSIEKTESQGNKNVGGCIDDDVNPTAVLFLKDE